MKAAYFDCFSGISGDMCLGALIDAGLDFCALEQSLKGLAASGYSLSARKVVRAGLAATKVDVHVLEKQPHRNLGEICSIINKSKIPEKVKTDACLVFQKLVEAEAKVHGTEVNKAHLHEAGATDALVDVVGTLLGLDIMGVKAVYASPLPLGGGSVVCEHGLIPVPAPATLELLKGMPIAPSPAQTELVTPTGAALIAALALEVGHFPALKIAAIGYGAGTRNLPHSNVLRLIVGELLAEEQTTDFLWDTVAVVEATIDDMNPEIFSSLGDSLFAAGALDFYFTPVYMKKSRPGTKVTVLCSVNDFNRVSAQILQETTTLGCRIRKEQRMKADRHFLIVATPFGEVDVKYSLITNTISPEYECCARKAQASGVPVKMVYDAAKAEAWKLLKEQS